MADNSKNNPSNDDEFNFEDNWTNEEDKGGDNSFSSDDFSAMISPEDDDPFAVEDDATAFGEPDNSFNAFDDDENFHSMPTPNFENKDNNAFDTDTDIIDDFSDVSTDDGFGFTSETNSDDSFSDADGFADSDGLFAEPVALEEDLNDPYDNNAFNENALSSEEDSGFLQNDQPDTSAANSNSPAAEKGKSKIFLVGVAAAALFIGYAGYTTVLPMFSNNGYVEEVPVANIPSTESVAPQFPTALPGQNADNALPSTVAPSVTLDVNENSPAPAVTLPPIATEETTTVAVLPSGNEVNGLAPVVNNSLPLPVDGNSNLTIPPITLPSGEQVDSVIEDEDSITGSNGGIVSMRDQGAVLLSPATPSANNVQSNAEILEIVKSLESGITAIENRLTALENNMKDEVKLAISNEMSDNSLSSNTVPSYPVVSNNEVAYNMTSNSKPPLKPTIVENLSLKGVSRGMAWIKTETGIIEARVGDDLENVGKVLGIKEYNGSWMVSTDKGLILQ